MELVHTIVQTNEYDQGLIQSGQAWSFQESKLFVE